MALSGAVGAECRFVSLYVGMEIGAQTACPGTAATGCGSLFFSLISRWLARARSSDGAGIRPSPSRALACCARFRCACEVACVPHTARFTTCVVPRWVELRAASLISRRFAALTAPLFLFSRGAPRIERAQGCWRASARRPVGLWRAAHGSVVPARSLVFHRPPASQLTLLRDANHPECCLVNGSILFRSRAWRDLDDKAFCQKVSGYILR